MREFNKKIRILVATALLTTLTTGFAFGSAIGDVLYQATIPITDDILWDEKIAINTNGGVQHAFITHIDTQGGSVEPYVYVGDVTGRSSMTQIAAQLKQEGYTVVTGINGDFFDTSSGTPLGMSIHDGKIKNTGAPYSNAIGFREDGSVFVAPVVLTHSFIIEKGEHHLEDDAVIDSANDSEAFENNVTTNIINGEENEGGNESMGINYGEPYSFGEINKPKGAANGLHFYNRQYGPTTKTIGNNVEVVLEAEASPEPMINQPLRATVKAIYFNASNTPIGDKEIVLSADSTTFNATLLSALVSGDYVTFSVEDQQNIWNQAKEAIGAHQIIAENGMVKINDSSLNPRTCIGIKEDGSLMLFAVDGRNPGYSVGMKLVDIAHYLIERGCTTVVNMDGGGSTSFMARLPGYEDSKIINRPSDGRERLVSNAVFFVKKDVTKELFSRLHIYPLSSYMMPSSEMQLEIKGTDRDYDPVEVPYYLYYSADSRVGTITTDGIVIAGENEAVGDVFVQAGPVRATKTIRVTKDIEFYPDTERVLIEPENATDISIKAYHKSYIPVITQDNLFSWECDPRIGVIDQNGFFVATNQTGRSGNIYISYNGQKKTIPVQVGPEKEPFYDTGEHWAKQYIENLASKGIVNGMGDNLFEPDTQLTKAQFLTMIANIVYDIKIESDMQYFTDVYAEDWYAKYVNWAYENGIVNGNPDGTFQPNAPITREQMALILDNFVKADGINYEIVSEESVVFTDENDISSWSYDAVKMVALAGIINGRPEGNYDPQGLATRAEASKVIHGVVSLIENEKI
jgi:exopolysaccharide biosynthesis protein